MPAPTLFISDLHLTPERPAAARLYQRFLEQIVPGAEALYILGDFFEAWVGDDDLTAPFNLEIASGLRDLSASGTRIFVMHGNRDFLLGEQFAQSAGLSLLPDPSVIDLHGTPTLLAHGDAWCSDDTAYQTLRAQVRNPAWQAAILGRPLHERYALARTMREQSESNKSGNKPEIMDVNAGAIEAAFRDHAVTRMIHGHTHRPARHVHNVDGTTRERWVLPDWYENGGYLRCDADGCQLLGFS